MRAYKSTRVLISRTRLKIRNAPKTSLTAVNFAHGQWTLRHGQVLWAPGPNGRQGRPACYVYFYGKNAVLYLLCCTVLFTLCSALHSAAFDSAGIPRRQVAGDPMLPPAGEPHAGKGKLAGFRKSSETLIKPVVFDVF